MTKYVIPPLRWLLLGFQREFEHCDALRLFEILSCDHLELISQKVERARYQERLVQKWNAGEVQNYTCITCMKVFFLLIPVKSLTNMSACVRRGQLRDRAAGHQHGLHLWTLHLRGHPAGEQRVSAAVPRWCAAHPVHQQVRLAHKATGQHQRGSFLSPILLIPHKCAFCSAFRERWIWTAYLRRQRATCTTTASAARGTTWAESAGLTRAEERTSFICSVVCLF